jgi:enamine deaminase RidA (YjgF/YER057c/UK114 family)
MKTSRNLHTGNGLYTVSIGHDTVATSHTTLWPLAGEPAEGMVGRLRAELARLGGSIVKCDIFGPLGQHGPLAAALDAAFGPLSWPITWVEGAGCFGPGCAGMYVRSVAGTAVDTIVCDDTVAGRMYETAVARYCCLGGIHAAAPTATASQQTLLTLERLEAALNRAGMDMKNLIRTWFFNDNILDWYDTFNAVRSRFYRERGVLDRMIPASTGIGGKNPAQAALVAGAEAIVFKSPDTSVQVVASPLQNSATSYGSSFSRAVEVATPHCRRLIVSGTASIDKTGQTVFLDDVRGQITQTMKVVEALLASRDMSWPDVVRAYAYVKQSADAPAFSQHLASASLSAVPFIVAENDICRGNLLFEIEFDAVTVTEQR